jgi:hypothetical protein
MFGQNSSYSVALIVGLTVAAVTAFIALVHAVSDYQLLG